MQKNRCNVVDGEFIPPKGVNPSPNILKQYLNDPLFKNAYY